MPILRFRVHGTHCASCEIVLERELKQLAGVEKVEASHLAAEVTLTVADGTRITTDDLDRVMKQHGYSFAQLSEGSHKQGDPDVLSRVGGAVMLIIAVYLVVQWTGLLSFSPDVSQGGGLGAVFVLGLVAAVSSCTAVVGGLIAAVSSRNAQRHADASFVTKMTPHILFNIGRIIGFALFGAAIGFLGQAFSLSTQANGILVILVALLMVGIGIQLMDVAPAGLAIRPPKWLSHRIHALAQDDRAWVPSVLGALTFFLPCGFTQSVQLFAMTTGSPVEAALIMVVFALGTAPALLGIGAATSSFKGKKLAYATRIVGAFVIVLGVTNVRNGAALLGFSGSSSREDTEGSSAVLVNGKQLVQMEVTRYGYQPEVLEVVEDIPVTWEIHGGEVLGCASSLVVPKMGITKTIVPGFNTINFTPTEPGTYAFSCSMGMYRGTLIVRKS
ncbi:MAG: sulfite exporter TauE/SafE family protein [Candidatus Uhrbacteria bacterium]|nr:sulfite exporter TauE/SafE family protein [Candidatus Uhrbacteria bacterium]